LPAASNYLKQAFACCKPLAATSLCLLQAFACSKPLPTSLQLLEDMEVKNILENYTSLK